MYSELRHVALCLQTKVLPHWLVTSTLKCMPIHHKMSGYEGIISDILTMCCWYLISLPFSSTEMILQHTIILLCWWIMWCLKQWLMFVFICTSTNLIQMPLFKKRFSCPTSYSWISVLFPWHVLRIVQYVSVSGVSVAFNEIFVHMNTHLSKVDDINNFKTYLIYIYIYTWVTKDATGT